jgi:hypothetical protein
MDLCVAVCMCVLIGTVAQSHKPIDTHTHTHTHAHTSLHSPVVHSKQLSTNKHTNIYYGKKFIFN